MCASVARHRCDTPHVAAQALEHRHHGLDGDDLCAGRKQHARELARAEIERRPAGAKTEHVAQPVQRLWGIVGAPAT